MKKLNKIILSSIALPGLASGILPLASCNRKGEIEDKVSETEWKKAFKQFVELGESKPTFKCDEWDDHIIVKDENGNKTLELRDIVFQNGKISCVEKVKNEQWYDSYGPNVDYIQRGEGTYSIINLYESVIPAILYMHATECMPCFGDFTFDTFAGQYSWQGDYTLEKNVKSIVAFNKNKQISLLYVSFDLVDQTSKVIKKYDCELHFKYGDTIKVEFPQTFATRISNHTFNLDLSSQKEVDLSLAGTEQEGFNFIVKNCPNNTESLTFVNDSQVAQDVIPTDEFHIYKNNVAMQTSSYSVANGKISFNDALTVDDKIEFFFKPKLAQKLHLTTQQ